MSKEIKLSRGYVAIIDDEDYECIAKRKWWTSYSRGKLYAKTAFFIDGKRIDLKLHHEIIVVPIGLEVDHINGNGLDNRKENLRVCVHQENTQNKITRRQDGKASRFTGVSRRNGAWYARITKDGKTTNIGVFKTEENAATAYNIFADKLFGDFARMNEAQNG